MNQTEAIKILQELKDRTQVATAVKENFSLQAESKIRRGHLHEIVAIHINATKSNKLLKQIKDFLATLGVRAVTVNGDKYYKGIERKERR